MIRRLFLIVFVFCFLGLVWVGSLAAVTITIFKERHPEKCMAYYYNLASPEGVSWDCEGSNAKLNHPLREE
jgi:hypothetical protein